MARSRPFCLSWESNAASVYIAPARLLLHPRAKIRSSPACNTLLLLSPSPPSRRGCALMHLAATQREGGRRWGCPILRGEPARGGGGKAIGKDVRISIIHLSAPCRPRLAARWTKKNGSSSYLLPLKTAPLRRGEKERLRKRQMSSPLDARAANLPCEGRQEELFSVALTRTTTPARDLRRNERRRANSDEAVKIFVPPKSSLASLFLPSLTSLLHSCLAA